jgi:DNA-binding transcriptional MerR regulator
MNDTTLLSIKEFSKLTGVNRSTLRYYDEIGLLPPAGRGENNYRYYAPFQIIVLNFINVLVDLGVPLSTIKDLSVERTPKNVIELLSKQELALDKSLYELQTAYSIIHSYRNNIQSGLLARAGEISVQEINESRYVLGPENEWTGKDSFYEAFISFCNSAIKNKINLRYPIGGYHDDINAFLKAPGQPDRFFSEDPHGDKIRKAGQYLVAYNCGYYGQFEDVSQKMLSYAEEYDLVFNGPVHVIYLLDEVSIANPSQYLSRISVSVSAKRNRLHSKPKTIS